MKATDRTCNRRRFLHGTIGVTATGLLLGQVRRLSAGILEEAGGYRIGIYTRPWDAFDYRVALDAAATAGYRYVGLMTTTLPGRRLVITPDIPREEAAAIGEEITKRNLVLTSVYSDFNLSAGQEAAVASLQRLIDNCKAAGATSILLGGTGNPKLYDLYYDTIKACCDYAAERSIVLTIKPHGGLNATGPDCRKAIEKVGHPNFSLWYDPGNILFYSDGKLDPVDDAAQVDGLVRHGMCIKDFVMSQEGGQLRKDVWVTPGKGRVDFFAVLRRLRQGGFTSGDLVVECVDRPNPRDADGILSAAKATRIFLEKLVAQVLKSA
ncbi:MAG: sugar phosphate isomerase/epimerase [Thermoguttaceae bacterium]|nr:sugar phosphate isomerase/epimerase [Thermoguttaceae bacterium]MDW8078304.1 sugar phosphate isomerase/epimerase family protein [Thermoguttaceae bacterium]